MTLPIQPNAKLSRRAALAEARQSRRPSRLGTRAGAAGKPDVVLADDAGFPGLLNRTWERAAAEDLPEAVDTLLTLAGHVPADVQLRALRMADECALKVLAGRTWRGDDQAPRNVPPVNPAFLGEIGLDTSGRVVVRVPSRGPLSAEEDLVGGVLRVAWSAQDVADYRAEVEVARARSRVAVADCRDWLAGGNVRDTLENLKEAARRTAPFVLYQEDRQYTNFRDRNTLTGKTLWPGHPDCALSSLQAIPLDLWSDNDVVMVVALTLLVRSAGFGRIEEANGTQLTIDHVAHLLERTRLGYNGVPGGPKVPPAASTRMAALNDLAEALGRRRREVAKTVQLYREIHGPLMHKIERVAAAPTDAVRRLEAEMCVRLRDRLPVSGDTLGEFGAGIEESPGWLAEPHGEFQTGLEAVIYETVRAATAVFEADFAMSRGIRSLTALIQALRAAEWARITTWDLPHYFCCVVPSPTAHRHSGDSLPALADTAWAISSRMQYNSWHFLAGNLPKVPDVTDRDFFVPPTIPDIAYYSDQHHRGHVAAKVRFSIRSPQDVEILGRPFGGFVDLRLLRCEGPPFGEDDLLAAQRASAFVARTTGAAAALAADGADVEITSFGSRWHWAEIVTR